MYFCHNKKQGIIINFHQKLIIAERNKRETLEVFRQFFRTNVSID